MPNKFKIDLRGGVIEADGESDFVEKVYKDFKTELLKRLAAGNNFDDNGGGQDEEGHAPPRSSGKPASGKRPAAKRAGASCSKRILDLKAKNAFKDGLFADDVRAKLKADGHIYASNQVGAALTTLHKRGELRRTEKDGKWLYLKP